MTNGPRKAYTIFIVTCLAFLFFDQFTKYLVVKYLPLYQPQVVWEGFFNLIHARNPGAAFGLLADAPLLVRRFFLLIVTSVVLVSVAVYFWWSKNFQTRFTFSLALILGGGLGNLIDRIRLGEVIDFLDFHIGSFHWPTFNAADSAITLGAILFLIDHFQSPEPPGKKTARKRKGLSKTNP